MKQIYFTSHYLTMKYLPWMPFVQLVLAVISSLHLSVGP